MTAVRDRGTRIRVAIVGAGYIADFHLEILRRIPEVEIVAVCDLDPERARASAARFGVERTLTSIDELARIEVDVAHVLVPPDHHAGVARALLELGIGVFAEKPLALSAADARALAVLAEEKKLPLGVNHNAVFRPVFQRCLAAARDGSIGRIEHVQVTLSVPLRQLDAGQFGHWMFRAPGNIVLEQACHPFSQLVSVLGRVEKMQVSILGTRELNPGQVFHDRWLIGATAERGTAELLLAFGSGFPRSTIQLLGTDGSVEADLFHDHFSFERKTQWLDFWNSFLAGWRRGGSLRRSARQNLVGWIRHTLGVGKRADGFFLGMQGSIEAFHRALWTGAPVPVGAEHGVRTLEWCDAAVAGLEEGEAASANAPAELATSAARTGEVCVLGASGFIGQHTIERLLDASHPVTAVVRRRHSLPSVITDAATDGRLRLLAADLEDSDGLRAAIRGARVVVHLATGGGDTWEDIERAMVHGTRALAEACREEGVERLIYASSTAALYLGRDAGREIGDAVPPDAEPEKRALYARGKIAAEKELARLHHERGLPVTIVRPAVVLGRGAPLQHSGIGLWVRDNHCVGWGTGENALPVVLVEDVADALVRLVEHGEADLDGRALNLSSRAHLTARDLVAAFRAATGRDFHFHSRPLLFSQVLELGKWVVKRVGGRRVPAPSYRDLKSRELFPRLACERARGVLSWQPCDDAKEFLDRFLDASPELERRVAGRG